MNQIPPFPPEYARALTAEELERVAIRTVDGTMTDAEAIREEKLTRKLWAAKAEETRK